MVPFINGLERYIDSIMFRQLNFNPHRKDTKENLFEEVINDGKAGNMLGIIQG